MKQGLVSVVVPVYNAEATISKCVRSILAQSYSNFEVILVDDGSTDDSLTICRGLEAEDKRISVFSQKNAGPSAARNNGIDHASGEYVAFVDSDDRVDPRMLDRMVASLADGASLSCCGVEKTFGDNSGYFSICDHDLIVDSKTYLSDMLLGHLAGYACNRIYPRSLIGETRFPVDLKFAEDLVFNCSLWCKIKEVAYVSDCLYVYEQRSGSLTNCSDAYIVDGEWVFSLLSSRLMSLLPDEPWVKELLECRSAGRALDGIRLLSGDERYSNVRAKLIEEFCASKDVYWKHQKSLVKRLLAWLTIRLPEPLIRLGMALLVRG